MRGTNHRSVFTAVPRYLVLATLILLASALSSPMSAQAFPKEKSAQSDKIANKTVMIGGETKLSIEPMAHNCDHMSTIGCTSTTTTATGDISTADCLVNDGSYVDFYQFFGSAGNTVTIDMTSTAVDSYLFLIDPSMTNVVAQDDDGGGGDNARIIYTLTQTGTWYISANTFDANDFGTYSLSIRCGVTTTCTPVPDSISCSATRSGTLSTADCRLADDTYYDVFNFNGTSGQQITVQMRSTAFDSYLYLYNPSGTLITSDDDGAGGNDAQITFTLNATGTWQIYANSFFPDSTGSYTVTLTCCTTVPDSISCNATRSGTLSTTDCKLADNTHYDVFNFSGTSGQQITVQMRSTAFDSLLYLYNPSGTLITSDDDGAGGNDAQITFTLNATGTWQIYANSFFPDSTGSYTVTLTCGGTSPPGATRRRRAVRRG